MGSARSTDEAGGCEGVLQGGEGCLSMMFIGWWGCRGDTQYPDMYITNHYSAYFQAYSLDALLGPSALLLNWEPMHDGS